MPGIQRHRPGPALLASSYYLSFLLLVGLAGHGLAQEAKPTPTNPANLRRTVIVEVVDKTKAAIVNIHSERTVSTSSRDKMLDHAQTHHRVNGMGTGVIIDSRGYIVTNHHVVDDVQLLRVRLHDGTGLAARIIARDPEADLAIIKIDHSKPLPTASFGTATDLMLGEPVIAIGNAFGYEHTVTTGIVSALKRDVSLNKEVNYKSLIQTDASINPGNSGGPLLNIYGELVGINVAIRAGAQGIGFAIPVDSMIKVVTELMSSKRRTGTHHGLVLKNEVDTSSNPVRRWAVVDRCEPNSPAAKAGLQAGDVLDQVGDFKIACSLDLERALLDRPAGEKLDVIARRNTNNKGEGGEVVKGDLILRPIERVVATTPNDVVWKKLGVKILPATAESVARVNPNLHGGLLITDVNPDTPAAKAGFMRGDILIGLHQWETVTIDNVIFVLNHQDLSSFSPVRYFRVRNGQLQRGFLPQFP